MDLSLFQTAATGFAGLLVGLVLALVGGGGSILAVPLLVHVVGIAPPHLAIGTSAVAVALNAAIGLVGHARAGNVRWPCASVFAAVGMVAAAIGASVGKQVGGNALLTAFAVLMIAVAFSMLWRREPLAAPEVRLSKGNAPALVGTGTPVGLLSGFFGIGGGFLAVPGLIAATGMGTLPAIGSSLVAVSALGVTTAVSYAWSGLVDWRVASLFVAGGVVGGFGGIAVASRLSARRGLLGRLFAIVLILLAVAMLLRG